MRQARAALLYGINDLRLVDQPPPVAGPDDLLVRVHTCGVCPTDLRKYRTGDNGSLRLPMNLGHEWAGEIVEVGTNVGGFAPGMRTIGDTYDGYGDYAVISGETLALSFPSGPLDIPDSISDEELTFVEPLADCLHAVHDQAQVREGQTVLILGAGQMGLQLTGVCHAAGARVIVSEPLATRRALAAEFGASQLLDPTRDNVESEVLHLTDGEGADVVIIAIGLPSLVNQSLHICRPLGRVILFAGFERPARVEIDPNLIHYKEIVLTGSEWIGTPPHHRPELYQQAIDMIARGTVPVARLITHRFPLGQIQEAFQAAADHHSLKVVVHMTPGE
jgi:L-iditol 2-dehydrogenase